MANSSAIVIDLSGYSFAGEPAPAYADPFDGLTDTELGDLFDAMDEVGLLDDEGDPVRYNEDYSGAVEQFDAAFTARAQAEQAREDARAAAIVEDLMHPARRDEDRMARIISRAQDGVYSGQQADFASEAAAVEITLANGGQGPCGPADEYGRCSSRYHSTDCAHQVGVDWLASGPPRSTGEAALANFASGLELANPGSYYGDPDDDDQPWQPVPQHTVELAHQLAADWGLGADAGGFGEATSYADPLRLPASPVSVADAVYEGMGYELPSQEQPSYPGIAQLARDLGLKRASPTSRWSPST